MEWFELGSQFIPKAGQLKMNLPEVSKAEMEQCLDRVMSSQVFSGADRIQEFLRYVVVETIEGRAGSIKGKTVALDVYGRRATSDGDPENVVRVEARRLRRLLSGYYEAEGQNDPIRIHIDSGGYAPRFEVISTSAPTPETQSPANESQWKTKVVLAACAALILLGFYVWMSSNRSTPIGVADLKKLERQAFLGKSVTALQAANMADQAKNMIFPLFDIERQKLALGMFEQAIRLDPEFFGGYAGAAHSLAALAILSQDPGQKATYLEQASERIEKTINLNPTDAWTQASAAWVAFAKDDYDKAQELSRRAYSLNHDDWYVSDIHGVVTLFTGNFSEARDVSDPTAASAGSNQRSGNRNVYAVANFHLGEFRKTLTALRETGEQGGPVSPLTLAYQAAAKHALGDLEGARNSTSELMATWPDFRVEIMLLSLFKNPAHAHDVVKRLQESGWQAER